MPPILYSDSDLLVVDKPPGLLTVPGKGPDKQDCLINRLLPGFPNARIVHRLDQPTSGLVIIPLGYEPQRHIARQFEQRQVGKCYTAIVAGRVMADSGDIDQPLICDWPNRPRQKIDYTDGKAALTHYRVLARGEDWSRVELRPHTGRSHQLRVHMQWLGHPIIGDGLYAPPEWFERSDRLLLHAQALEFTHPGTGTTLCLKSEAQFGPQYSRL